MQISNRLASYLARCPLELIEEAPSHLVVVVGGGGGGGAVVVV